jgi:Spy/CpxP family protein refolding chaperone
MKIRKLLVGAAVVGVLFSTSLLQAQDQKKKEGQGGGRGMPTAEQQIERIEQAVGTLSADQKTKLKAIYAKTAEKMQAIPQEERREKGMEVYQETRKQVRAVLTPEQQKKYDEMPQGRGQGGKKKEN